MHSSIQRTATMKEISPHNSTNDASPEDANECFEGAAGDRGGGVAVANRPTPSPPAATAASASIESKTDVNAKAAVVVIKNETDQEKAKGDGSGLRTSATMAATAFLSSTSTKNLSTMSMSLQQPGEETAVTYQPTKFTPIRSSYSIAAQSVSRGSGHSIVATPGPATARSMEMNLLGQEMLAASSAGTAAMTQGYDHDEYSINRELGMIMTPAPPLDEVNFTHDYPGRQDDFALPPFLQAHLDETYAASSSSSKLVLPPISSSDDIGKEEDEENLLQITSYLIPPLPTTTAPFHVSALGIAQPNPTGRRVAVNNGNVHTSSSMAPLARAKKMTAAAETSFFATTSSTKNRPARSLPLRKRPLRGEEEQEVETDDTNELVVEEKVAKKSSNRPRGPSKKKPSVKKPTMVRHNYNENRFSCKCAKSRCLKLYCDCFQSGRMCDPGECECSQCMNLEKYNGPNGARTKAINECLAKNPKAFEKRQKSADEGCGCKRNKCLKKYCVCFNAGTLCDESCRCKNCENQEVEVEEDGIMLAGEATEDAGLKVDAESEVVVEEPPTKYVKVASVKATTSPVTDSSDSIESLPYALQTHEDAHQMYNVIQGDFYGHIESSLTAEV